jgi:hypothetical protein
VSIVRPAAAVTTLFARSSAARTPAKTNNPHYNAAVTAVKNLLKDFPASREVATTTRQLTE